jgi:hypothetical protein
MVATKQAPQTITEYAPPAGEVFFEKVLQPTTGKAFPLLRGQVLRVEQIGNGQCLDFNAYNLHDYKDHLHTLRTLSMEGAWPTTGNFLWSRPPRERQMMTIIADTVGHNDTLGARCSALINEYRYGLDYHTNCQDIFAETIREYGLSPDDTHDSFNGFMNTFMDEHGRMSSKRNYAKPGDYIEMLAQMDLLVVPIACGSSYGPVSNFENKGLKIIAYDATEEQKLKWLIPEGRRFKRQMVPEDYAISGIRTERELTADPTYTANYWWLPITKQAIPVTFSLDEMELVDALRATGEWGEDSSDIVRAVFISWWVQHMSPRQS